MSTTVQSQSAMTDASTVASPPKPIPTSAADTATPSRTTTSVPVSTAAIAEIPTVAVPTAPIVIERQLKEVRPYDGSTSWKSFR